MRYVVISQKNKLCCFEDREKIAEYCMDKDNVYMDKYCKDQQLEYENMTSVEIGYTYSVVGAEWGGCRVYPVNEVYRAIVDAGEGGETVKEIERLFNDTPLETEIDCPSYLEDVLVDLNPIPVSEFAGGVYISQNIDGPSHHRRNSGI